MGKSLLLGGAGLLLALFVVWVAIGIANPITGGRSNIAPYLESPYPTAESQ